MDNAGRKLQPIGQLIMADETGRLPRLGRAPAPVWAHELDAITRMLAAAGMGQQCSLLLRGSLARGSAVPGVSDIDLVLVSDALVERDLPDLASMDAELVLLRCDDLLHAKTKRWIRFTLALNGHTLTGPDILPALPEPRLGPEAVAHLPKVARWGRSWRALCTQHPPQLVCRWLMKRILRAGFESVMLDLNAYTRDIYPAARALADRFPEQGALFWQAAEWVVAPVEEPAKIASVAERLLPWLEMRLEDLRAQEPHWRDLRP
ncbi:MAG: nucleotidyltransferase domain-containing protein [Pseudomonadota bacterium]